MGVKDQQTQSKTKKRNRPKPTSPKKTSPKKRPEAYSPQVVSPHPRPELAEIATTLEGLEWYYEGISALESLYRRPHGGYRFVCVIGPNTELAKRIDGLRFPGLEGVDASAEFQDGKYYFRCVDERPSGKQLSVVTPLTFFWDPRAHKSFDPAGNYAAVRNKNWEPERGDNGRYAYITAGTIPELAIFSSRFMTKIEPGLLEPIPGEEWPLLPIEEQRRTLSLILSGPFSHVGLQILHRSGYTKIFLPELMPMDGTRHSKEGHPEGNVWEHSLETLKYRKITDLGLSFALLLHDSGKPQAVPTRQKMFDKHAELGAALAFSLLRRLGFDRSFIEDVCWLVEFHMIPPALSELPLSRSERFMEHSLFPLLLELYRCDLISTWRGPEDYYEACKKFRAWLKTKRNPYLNLDRKRQIQRFVAS